MNAEEAALAVVGQTIADKYRVLSLLGAGGMGAVYEAEHVFTKRRVALKRMHNNIAKSKLAAERFIRESQAPSSIGHPGIVQVLDGGIEADGSLYLVLELLTGVSLREALEEEALDPANVVTVAIELLEALAAAHDKGFIHRDIKPDNIFLADDGRGDVSVKLLDFGIASMRDTDVDVKLTQTGAVLGTPTYMSPEQAKGLRVDARSDLWSVGVMLYRALCGASPFSGESYNALIVSIVTQDHVPLVERRKDLPRALLEAVEGALHKEPEERFRDARAMLEALRAVSFAQPLPPASLLPQRLRAKAPDAKAPAPDAANATRAARRAPRVEEASRITPPPAALQAVARAPSSATAPRALSPMLLSPARSESSSVLSKLLLAALVCALSVTLFIVLRPRSQTAPAPAVAAPTVVVSEPSTKRPELAPLAATQQAQPSALPSNAGATPAAAPAPAAAAPAPAPPSAAVSLPADAITAVLSAQESQMQACLQETVVAQMTAGNPVGKALRIDITLHIAPSGTVERVETRGEVPDSLTSCVRAHLQAALFPSATAATEFKYPLLFQSTVVGN